MSDDAIKRAWRDAKPEQKLGDAPIEDAYRLKMNAVAAGLDDIFNDEAKGDKREVGFVLMVFPFGDHSGRCNYISNGADRRDIVTLMKEMIAKFTGQPDVEGSA